MKLLRVTFLKTDNFLQEQNQMSGLVSSQIEKADDC